MPIMHSNVACNVNVFRFNDFFFLLRQIKKKKVRKVEYEEFLKKCLGLLKVVILKKGTVQWIVCIEKKKKCLS